VSIPLVEFYDRDNGAQFKRTWQMQAPSFHNLPGFHFVFLRLMSSDICLSVNMLYLLSYWYNWEFYGVLHITLLTDSHFDAHQTIIAHTSHLKPLQNDVYIVWPSFGKKTQDTLQEEMEDARDGMGRIGVGGHIYMLKTDQIYYLK
jgi:hypothetical protein